MKFPSLLPFLRRVAPACLLILPSTAPAEEGAPVVSIHRSGPAEWTLSWQGAEGYTWFPQVSPGHDLLGFSFLPLADYITGDGLKSFVVEGDPLVESRNFYRLKYTDLDPANLAGDGVPALFKINTLGIDPFAPDVTGTNGLANAWEAYFFGIENVDQVSPSAVLQPDGLTNKEKADLGLDPDVDYATSPDRSQYQYDDAGRLVEVEAPLTGATYLPDEEGNLNAH